MSPQENGLARREATEGKIVLGLLDVVERNPAVTQRLVARELGIALGLANAYLKRCIRKGLIKVGQAPPRRFTYYLTPQGFAEKSRLTASYLAHSLSFLRRARQHCGELFVVAVGNRHTQLALIGPGDLAEIATLVATQFPVIIVGILPADEKPAALIEAAAALGSVDAFVLTALEHPFEVFSASIEAFGASRVYAPKLLRVQPPATAEAKR